MSALLAGACDNHYSVSHCYVGYLHWIELVLHYADGALSAPVLDSRESNKYGHDRTYCRSVQAGDSVRNCSGVRITGYTSTIPVDELWCKEGESEIPALIVRRHSSGRGVRF